MKVNVSAKNIFPSERYIDAMLMMYRVFLKNVVFFCSMPPQFIAAARDFPSSQCNTSVQSLLLAVHFLYNQKQPSACEREEVALLKFLGKNTTFLNTL